MVIFFPFLSPQDLKYELYAIVHHFGDLTGGHYTAQIKSFENQQWYIFNDDIVKKVRRIFFSVHSAVHQFL